MKLNKWKDLRDKNISPERLEKIEESVDKEVLAMNLKEIRKMLGLTQTKVSKAAKMNQSDLSRLENRKDHLISTLQRYIKAMGGEMDIIARFGDKEISLFDLDKKT